MRPYLNDDSFSLRTLFFDQCLIPEDGQYICLKLGVSGVTS